ncbi:hypothetical protein SAMN05443247_08679 [Bradyrhizobium erythrophlei]|nr:hypothetical protein SAMN05443247_08679 [Bradyrhizobium erythrophlei]
MRRDQYLFQDRSPPFPVLRNDASRRLYAPVHSIAGRGSATHQMVDLKLSDEKEALHKRLIEMRNKIMAHSDSEIDAGDISATEMRDR